VTNLPSLSPMELEVRRIRELSMSGRYHEALTAAQALAATGPKNRDVLYLIAANQRSLNQTKEALDTLVAVSQTNPETANNHLLVSIARAFGVAIDSFGSQLNDADKTGPLAGLT